MTVPAIPESVDRLKTPFLALAAAVAVALMLVIAPSAEAQSTPSTTIHQHIPPTPVVELDTGEAPSDLLNAYLTITVDVPTNYRSQPKIWLWNGEEWSHPTLTDGTVQVKVTNEFGKYRCYGAFAQYSGVFSDQSEYACYTAGLTPPKMRPLLLIDNPDVPQLFFAHRGRNGLENADRYLGMQVHDGTETKWFSLPFENDTIWGRASFADAKTCFRARYVMTHPNGQHGALKATPWGKEACIDLRNR